MNHEHSVCSSKIEQHIHEKDIDCSLHLIKQGDSYLALSYPIILPKLIITDNYKLNYNFLKNHTQLTFSLRGPPQTS